jgi:hypothetical protein
VRIDLFFAGAPAAKLLATKNRSPRGWAVATKFHHRGRCCVAALFKDKPLLPPVLHSNSSAVDVLAALETLRDLSGSVGGVPTVR